MKILEREVALREIYPRIKISGCAWVRKHIKLILLILVVAAISVYSSTQATKLSFFEDHGLWGLFAIAICVNAALFWFPYLAFPFLIVMGNEHGAFWAAMVYAGGATIGESVGYWLGYFGIRAISKDSKYYSKVNGWLTHRNFLKRNLLYISGLSAQPIFPFDIIGLIAGSLRYSFWQFFIFCLIGRVFKYWLTIRIGWEAIDIWRWIF